MIKKSVVIPCYNSSRTIEIVLIGLEKQNLSPLEVIVVDDCSIDDTGTVALKHNVKLITLEQNSGPAIARNRGARECKGEIILFLDSDAVPHNDLIANLSISIPSYRRRSSWQEWGDRGIEKIISSTADKWRARHASQNHGKKPLTYTSYLFGLCGSYLTEVF
jgi:glycosyltransferase involved in cell wall biosynthesis